MEKQSMTVKGIRLEANGLLRNNWSRALAALCVSLMTLMVFVLFNQFVLSIIRAVTQYDAAQNSAPATIQELLDYAQTKEMKMNLYITLLMCAFYFLVISPLNLGIDNWYQSLAICSNLKVGQIFYYYRTNELFLNALSFEVVRLIRHAAALALSFAPALVCIGTALKYLNEKASKEQINLIQPLLVAGCALVVVGFIVYAFIALSWFVAKYLYVGGHDYGVEDCFRYSRKFMKGKKGKVFELYLSCAVRWLLAVFIIPILYIVPYCKAILAIAAQDIIDEHISAE